MMCQLNTSTIPGFANNYNTFGGDSPAASPEDSSDSDFWERFKKNADRRPLLFRTT
jgi:hypothetical protein